MTQIKLSVDTAPWSLILEEFGIHNSGIRRWSTVQETLFTCPDQSLELTLLGRDGMNARYGNIEMYIFYIGGQMRGISNKFPPCFVHYQP